MKEAYKKFSNQSEYAPVVKGQLKGWAANKKAFLHSRKNRRSTHFMTLQNELNRFIDF